MNFNNGLYVFNEVPGYDASKGERIVKALHKFWIKIASLEQVRILEKRTLTKEVQTNDADLTLGDVQVELLRTQLYYLIKIAREYSNDEFSVSSECKNVHEKVQKSCQVNLSSNSSVRNIPENNSHMKSHEDVSVADLQDNAVSENHDEIKIRHKKFEIANSSEKPFASTFTSSISHMHPKVNSQPHYHLKLDDVPFILGASSSASHSVVANVQNIIAMMKMHNRALCASKPQVRQNVASTSLIPNKACPQDANEMLYELSEDLSKLTMKQEKLKKMFDNAQAAQLSDKTKKEENSSKDKKGKVKIIESICSCVDGQRVASSKRSEELLKNKEKETIKNKEKHLIPTDKMKTNNNHLARRKMLRSLQDFKVHLSEEDISWN